MQFYENAKSREYKEFLGVTARNQVLTTAVTIAGGGHPDFKLPLTNRRVVSTLRFNMRKPPSYPKRVVDHIKKPDLDNLTKSVWDGLVKASILSDDCLITEAHLSKHFACAEHPEGVEIRLLTMPTEVV